MSKSLTPERIAEILEKDIDEIKEFLV